MEDGQAILNQLAQAVQSINNPAASHGERHQAQDFIEGVKTKFGVGLGEFGFAFAEARHQADYIQHLGYHFLEHVINHHWNSLTSEDKAKLKGMIVSLLQSTPDDLPALFQEKTAQLLTEVAKREWPQQWPEFIDLLITNMQESDCKAEVVLRTIRTLAEETLACPFATKPPISNTGSKWDVIVLPASRRKDILLGLREIQDTLLNLLACFIQAKYSLLISAPTQQVKDVAARLINLVHTLLTALMEVIQMDICREMFKYKFPLMWISLMAEQEACKLAAALCTAEFVSETFSIHKYAADFTTFVSTLCDFTSQFTTQNLCPAESLKPYVDSIQQTHNFQKILARIFNALGTSNFKSIHQLNLLPKFVATTVILLQHPSLAVAECTLDLYAKMLQEELFRESADYQSNLHAILPLIKNKITKCVGDLDYTPLLPVTIYSMYDFDSNEEYGHCMGLIRSKACQMLIITTGVQPAACLHYVIWVSEELLKGCPQPSPNDARNEHGNISMRSQTYLQWESTSWVITTILDQIGSCSLEVIKTILNDPLKAALAPVINQWLDLTPQDGCIIPVYLSIIASFAPLFLTMGDSTHYLQTLLSKVFHYMTYRQEKETNKVCEDTKAARKKAHSTFIRLAARLPELLVPYLEMIVAHAKHLIQAGVLLDSEISFLFEAMAAISNKLPIENQVTFFEGMLTPAVTAWNQDILSVLQDGAAFLQVCGLSCAKNERSEHYRQMMQHYLNVFVGMYRRASPPASSSHSLVQIADRILPALLLLISMLHSIYDPNGMLQMIAPEYRPALALSAEEEVIIMGRVSAKSKQRHDPHHISATRKTLFNLRVTSYTLLGLLPQFSALLYTQMRETVRKYVCTAALHHAEDYHLKLLLQYFVGPFILHCPPDCHQALPLLVPQLNQFLSERLNQRWANCQQKMSASGHNMDDALDEEDVSAEMIQEIMEWRALRSLSVQCMEALDQLGTGMTEKDKKTPGDDKQKGNRERCQQLAQFLLSNESMASSTLMLVTAAMLWPDPQCALKAIKSASKFLPALCYDNRFDQPLYTLMGTCLQRLLSMAKPSATSSPAGATSAAQEAVSNMYRTSMEDTLITDMSNFICDIYCSKYQQMPAFTQLWAQLGMSPMQIEELHNSIQKPSEKVRRMAFRTVLRSLVGCNHTATPDSRVILQLPKYEVVSKPPPSTSWLEQESLCLHLLM